MACHGRGRHARPSLHRRTTDGAAPRRRDPVRGGPGRARLVSLLTACGSSTRSTARTSSASPGAATGRCTSRSRSAASPSSARSRSRRLASCTEPVIPRPIPRPSTDAGSASITSRSRSSHAAAVVAHTLDADIVTLGSAGAKAMAIVAGDADIYAHSGGQYEWDNAAPAAVAISAGLHVSRLDGSTLDLQPPGPVAPRPPHLPQGARATTC